MKRFIKILTICLCMIFFCDSISAHAGGGVGGGGGGGSSSGGGSSPGGDNTSSRGDSNPIMSILSMGSFIVISFGGSIMAIRLRNRKSREGHQMMKRLSTLDPIWNEDALNQYVSEIFYEIQYSWAAMDIDRLKHYLTPHLLEQWRGKLEWMNQREEINIMKDIQLKGRKVVGVYDFEDDDKDFVWYYIKASMIDYNMNRRTKVVTEGEPEKVITFEEYWKFQRIGNQFYLDDVMYTSEVDTDAFRSISESMKKDS